MSPLRTVTDAFRPEFGRSTRGPEGAAARRARTNEELFTETSAHTSTNDDALNEPYPVAELLRRKDVGSARGAEEGTNELHARTNNGITTGSSAQPNPAEGSLSGTDPVVELTRPKKGWSARGSEEPSTELHTRTSDEVCTGRAGQPQPSQGHLSDTDQVAALIESGAGPRKLAAELGVTEHAACQLLKAARNGDGS